jgi:protein tyrosine phosphatase (PTP) superfamily phosphohydrolase (DUF442 family)
MYLRWLVIFWATIGLAGGDDEVVPGKQAAKHESKSDDDGPIPAVGLHNVFRLGKQLYSGSSPEGKEGFQSLQKLGIRTIISVDGMSPDVETAKQFGLRYVHLPIGYDGVPREQALRLAKAVQELPGPVYVHCHHGQHRGPAAAAVTLLCLEPQFSVEQAEAFLHRAGTDPHYQGLISAPRSLVRPTKVELDCVVRDFPERSAISKLAHRMTEVDAIFEHLKLIKAANWQQPKDHPDLAPAHEALLLAEQFREAARATTRPQDEELQNWLKAAEGRAMELNAALRTRPNGVTVIEANWTQIKSNCAACHAKYRDLPRN